MPRSFLGGLLLSWLENYDDVLNTATTLLYAQIFVNLAGTLGTQATGVLDADVAVALFGLVAIASGYQSLGRTYAILLSFMIALDVAWLLLYSELLWSIFDTAGLWSNEGFSSLVVLAASALGFLLRVLSAMLWLQMFRLGWAASDMYETNPGGASPFLTMLPDFDQVSRGRASADHSPRFARQASHSDEFLGSSIFHPPSFAVLNQGQLNDYLRADSVSGSQASTDSPFEPPAKIPEEQEYLGESHDQGESSTPDEEASHHHNHHHQHHQHPQNDAELPSV